MNRPLNLHAIDFNALMHNAASGESAQQDQDECEKCGEHMLDCECDEATA